ncbi:hypothetical protein RESH_03244 [Rhodopirellula europaea SH398]|uniref:Uncharacterized protein n=1 Tax=Rhodopirellula europaea SH398 TaxID=1263868 RepID=M5S3K7_9BACT|nr:hypothetical protein RESH_03244 [Rhodopirellula europaea SH398]
MSLGDARDWQNQYQRNDHMNGWSQHGVFLRCLASELAETHRKNSVAK